MKTLGVKMVLLFFLMGRIAVMGQDRQEVPGDDFSLEGALELFKKSASPEEFERMLNSPGSKVNNLDLNGDGEIDYIRVIDRNEGNVHAFIMQAVLSPTESQDVAVIELEKLANGKAVLQITGDEDVYGIETIIEPTEEVRVNAGASTVHTVVNVWAWPSVRYVYSPYYEVWVSPWHWYYRPVWWFSWSPVAYYDYYSYWYPYRRYYAPCYTHRVAYARHMYRPHRTYSSLYYRRHESRIVHYRSTNHDRTRYSNDRNRYYNDNDRSRRTSSTVDRSNRSRYEGNNKYDGNNRRDNNTTQRTPVVRQRTSSENRTRTQFERKPERSSSRDKEIAYTNRSDNRNKPVMENRSPRQERPTMNTNRNSQPVKRSVDRSDNRGNSGGGERKSSNGGGNGNGRGNGKGRGNH